MRVDDLTKKQQYINEHFGEESELLREVSHRLNEDDKEGINISASEARILQTLIATSGVQSIVEIGCLYGYSALWMAEALPAEGKLYTLELSELNAAVAQEFFDRSANKDKIDLLVGDALKSLEKLSKNAPFDMVFIDANKGGYMNYLKWAIENVKPGGLIIGDNTFLFGHVYGEGSSKIGANPIKTMKEFNKTLSNQENFFSCIMPTSEGMTIAVKKL